MYLSKPTLMNRFLLLIAVITTMCSCSGGSGNSGVNEPDDPAPVLFQDSEGILSPIGITSNHELKEKISKEGALALSVEVRNANPDIPTEKVIQLLKNNNKNIEYQKLIDQGLDVKVINKLKELRFTPVEVEQFVELPDPDIFPIQPTPKALEELNKAKLQRLNRRLKLSGQASLTTDDFLALQNAFSQVDIINNFGTLDQQFQNILARDTMNQAAGKTKARNIPKSMQNAIPEGYALVNASDELRQNGDVGEVPFGDNSCFISRLPNLPMPIAQPNAPIQTPLVSSEGGDAIVSFPETGIAVIVTSRQATIVNDDDMPLSSGGANDSQVYYLPITNDNRCKPFKFIGASESYNVTLVDMIKPERLTNHVFLDGADYLSSGPAAELFNSNTLFNAKSYTFSTVNSNLPDLRLSFDLEYNDPAHAMFTYILYSPDGTVYSGNQNGPSENLNRYSGIWRLDILPANSISFLSNKIHGLEPTGVDIDHEKTFNVTTLINTDSQVQTKEFMLGIVKNISLKTQGETGTFDEGEVTIDLNTNMAPKLMIPSYIDDIIESGDEMNDTIALWQCWKDSEKTGLEFEANGDCFNYREEFLRRQEIYETLHTYDYQNDPQTYPCPDEDGMQDTCIKGILGPYNMNNPAETDKARIVMNDFSDFMNRQYQDVEYLNLLSNYYDLYQNWKTRTIQVDTAQFPYDGLPYKTQEFTKCNSEDPDCISSALTGNYPRIPVIMPTNRPIFGVPLDRLKDSTLPITFDYTASDQDVYDTNAANLAFLGYLASQTFNIVTGNFIGLLCGTVDLTDDLHDVEMAAQDDPLGSARVSINRYSSSDPFYGLHNQNAFHFFMSGVPEKNTQVDTYGQKLNYAQIACNLANLTSSGLQFAQNADLLLNLDYEQLGSAADVYKIIAGTSTAVGSVVLMAEAEEIAALIREGNIEEAKARMTTSDSINTLNEGQDLFDNLDSLINGYENVGSAGNGNNILKSSAEYLLGTDKKTRAEVEFERVSSVPVTSVSVSLDQVHIISNYEDDDKAEIRLYPFVGVVSDKASVGDDLLTLFSESESMGDGNHPWNYLRFNNVADGQTLTTPDTVLYSGGGYNAAAIYVELAVMEDDSLSIEDDDMIGVFSQTIKLEEIFNKNADFKWTFLGDNQYELVISDYPIYNSSNQLSLENPLSVDFERQKAHNQNRRPSARVSLTINLTMGDISLPHPIVDTSLDLGVMGNGRDTYSMNMKAVSEIDINGSILDVFDGKAIIGNTDDKMLTGTIVAYGTNPYYLINRFSYDINNFSGELLPIKEALTSSRSLAKGFRNNQNELVKELPLVRLLPDNRLLFAISHAGGARLMIVSYTNAGTMTLENSFLIRDADDNQVFSLLNATLSPNRTRLLVPYVPVDYAGTDKKIPAYTKLNLYGIDGATITLLSANSFGSGAPLTNVEFIDESHLAMITMPLVFGEDGYAWWPDWETVQATCTSADLDCLFELGGKNILLFTINTHNRLELTDSRDVFYTPPNEAYIKSYYPLKRILFLNSRGNDLQLVSTLEGYSSVLRLGLKIYQLNFHAPTNAFYFADSSSYQNVKSLRYNPEGEYYCADGITCSGYLRSALKPTSEDTNVYQSEDKIRTFEFADTNRDLALGIAGTKLQLLSLYDGAAYKGPHITGEIFNTDISVADSNPVHFSFTITDRDNSLNQLDIQTIVNTTSTPAGYGETLATWDCLEDANGVINCTGTVVTEANTSNLDQTIVIRVNDGVYTSDTSFRIFNIVPTIIIPFADGTNGIEAWSTDGTPGNTAMLNNANTNTSSWGGNSIVDFNAEMHRFNDKYFYSGNLGDGSVSEPFAATIGGIAEQLKVIDEGNGTGQYALPTEFTTLGNYVYFITRHSTYGKLLYRTDGTPAGTTLVKDILTQNNSNLIQFLNVINNKLLFFGHDDVNGSALWESDGTSGGTQIITGLHHKVGSIVPDEVILFNDKLIFSHFDSDGSNIELWVSDGTASGTQRLKDINPTGDSRPRVFIKSGETLFFMASHDNNGISLWKTDGTEAGTQLIKGQMGMNVAAGIDNTLYFIADDQTLWKSDGTDSGTVMVNALSTLPMTEVKKIHIHNNTLYFHVMWGETMKYTIHAMKPSVSYDLINVNVDISGDSVQYNNLNIYDESINNDLIYMTEDETRFSLWKHNIEDGSILIKTTDK